MRDNAVHGRGSSLLRDYSDQLRAFDGVSEPSMQSSHLFQVHLLAIYQATASIELWKDVLVSPKM